MWEPTLLADKPAYRALLDALTEDIRSGKLAAGTKLPPQRDLARALGLSTGTITRAYSLAERNGLVRGEVGRGTFVDDSSEDPLIGDLRECVDGAVNLSMTWPMPSLDPDLGGALRAISQEPQVNELLGYQPNNGCLRHRAAGARWLQHYGLEVEPSRVAVTAGAQHAMTVALGSILGPGETLLAEELTYPGLRACAEFSNVGLIGLPGDEDGIDPDAFEQACRKGRGRALYTIPTLQNPSGSTLPLERRQALAATAQRHGVYIIEDAIHQLLHPTAPVSIASLAPDHTVFLASPSKVVAGGLRVGFLTAPSTMMAKITQAIWATTWMVAPLCAEIFAQWIEDGTAIRTVANKRAEADARLQLARHYLPQETLGRVAGGYHVWVRLPAPHHCALEFAAESAKRGVLVTPASAFHIGKGRPVAAVRVSLSAPRTRERLRLGLERLEQTLNQDPALGTALV